MYYKKNMKLFEEMIKKIKYKSIKMNKNLSCFKKQISK